MVISFLNQKGGVGKTTLAINMAHFFSLDNRVLLIDSDPQQTALQWSSVRQWKAPFTVIAMPKKTIHRDIDDFVKYYDYIFIDSPPRVTELVRSCIMASDIVIIPCTPSAYDIWAAQETLELLKEACIYKEKLKYFFMINSKIINTVISKSALYMLEGLQVPMLKTSISRRTVFVEKAALGETIFDVKARCKGKEEMRQLGLEIKEILNGTEH